MYLAFNLIFMMLLKIVYFLNCYQIFRLICYLLIKDTVLTTTSLLLIKLNTVLVTRLSVPVCFIPFTVPLSKLWNIVGLIKKYFQIWFTSLKGSPTRFSSFIFFHHSNLPRPVPDGIKYLRF